MHGSLWDEWTRTIGTAFAGFTVRDGARWRHPFREHDDTNSEIVVACPAREVENRTGRGIRWEDY